MNLRRLEGEQNKKLSQIAFFMPLTIIFRFITTLLYHLTGTQDFSGKPLYQQFTAENPLKFRCVYVLLPLFFSGKPQFYDFTAE